MSFKIVSENVLTQIKNTGSASIHFKVDGFWSSSTITVYIRKGWDDAWDIYESHSSGGEDSNFEGTNIARVRNFAAAMVEAADQMYYWETFTDRLEAAYKEYRLELDRVRAEEEKQRKIGQALKAEAERLDRIKNPSMGYDAALELANDLRKQVRGTDKSYADATVHVRKDKNFTQLVHAENYRGRTAYYIGGKFYSRKDFIGYVANNYALSA